MNHQPPTDKNNESRITPGTSGSSVEQLRTKVGRFWQRAAVLACLTTLAVTVPMQASVPTRCFYAGLIFSVFIFIDQVTFWMARRAEQGRRNQNAKEILDRVRRQQSVRFSLYLRSFQIEGHHPYQRQRETSSVESWFPNGFGPIKVVSREETHHDFETVLSDAVGSEAPLVAIGRRNDTLGAGRIETSDADWREEFFHLAQRAETIYMVPHTTPGTHWEMGEVLRNNWCHKTVFILPTSDSDRFKATWMAAREQCASVGIEIPVFSRAGMVFMIGNDGRMTRSATWFSDLTRALRMLRDQKDHKSDPPVTTGEGLHSPVAPSASLEAGTKFVRTDFERVTTHRTGNGNMDENIHGKSWWQNLRFLKKWTRPMLASAVLIGLGVLIGVAINSPRVSTPPAQPDAPLAAGVSTPTASKPTPKPIVVAKEDAAVIPPASATKLEVTFQLRMQGDAARIDQMTQKMGGSLPFCAIALMRIAENDRGRVRSIEAADLQIKVPHTHLVEDVGKSRSRIPSGADLEIKAEEFPLRLGVTECRDEFNDLIPSARYLVRCYHRGRPIQTHIAKAGSRLDCGTETIETSTGRPAYEPSAIEDWQTVFLDVIASDVQRKAALDLFRRFPVGSKELESPSELHSLLVLALGRQPKPRRSGTRGPSTADWHPCAMAAVLLVGTNYPDQESLVVPLVNGQAKDLTDNSVTDWSKGLDDAIQRLPASVQVKSRTLKVQAISRERSSRGQTIIDVLP